jgi:hypothetical protein
MIQNNKSCEYGGEFYALAQLDVRVEQGLDFLLSHFEDFIWPRTVSTRTTKGRQILVYSKEEALARFKQADYLDCRISAYPNRKNIKYLKQTPNFLFFDIDDPNIDLDQTLQDTLANIKEKFETNAEPTVLWSGKGYHVWLPIDGIVLENHTLFEDIQVYDPSRKFIQWAEQYLTNEKADPCHSKGVSFNNCMLRVPGSINSKVGKEVRIVQRWNGIRPSIRPLLYEFYIHVADAKLMEIQGIRIKEPTSSKRVSAYWGTSK